MYYAYIITIIMAPEKGNRSHHHLIWYDYDTNDTIYEHSGCLKWEDVY